MANVEINDLSEESTPVSTDEIEIQKTGGGESLKATLGNVLQKILRILPIGKFKFDTAAGETVVQGEIAWNADEETCDLGLNGATLQLGQEVHYHVRNLTGVLISDGTPVMATGTVGASGRLTVSPMDGTNPANAKFFIGIATEDIADGTDGKVTHFGKIRGVNTSAFGDGDVLWISSTVIGGLTSTEPTQPAIGLPIAFVINSAVSGTLFVRAQGTDEHAFLLYDANNAVTDEAQEYTATQNFDATTLTDQANVAWDLAANQVATLTLGGNRTLDNPTNQVAGATYLLTVKQDGTGSRTLAYGSAYQWPGGTAPVITTTLTTGKDVLAFVSDGTNMMGTFTQDFN